MTDPRDTLITLFSSIKNSLKKDNGVDDVDIHVCREFEDRLVRLHESIITVGLAREESILLNIRGTKRQVTGFYDVDVWVRETIGVADTDNMRKVLVASVKVVVDLHWKSPGGDLSYMLFDGVSDSHRLDLKPPLYHSTVSIKTVRYEP